MQQLITSPRRATPRTLIASQQKKWTLRKPLISRSGWIEEKQKDRSRSNCHPSRRRNSKLSSSISGDVNKMKIRHDSLRLSKSLSPAILGRHAAFDEGRRLELCASGLSVDWPALFSLAGRFHFADQSSKLTTSFPSTIKVYRCSSGKSFSRMTHLLSSNSDTNGKR